MSIEPPFHSQWGQDAFIARFLMPHREGTFFEVGALDGLHLSNTLYFERERDWRGILVEMQPWYFPALPRNRPRAHCVNAALGTESMQQLFLNAGDRSGLLRHMNPADIVYLENHFRDAETKPAYTVHWVQVRPIMEVIAEAGLSRIEYFSLDVEGAELDILRGIDFARVRIDLFTIEDNTVRFTALRELLAPHGYQLIGSLGVDGLFVRHDTLAEIAARHGAAHVAAMLGALRPPAA
jgi:FkbM family methyltransferase